MSQKTIGGVLNMNSRYYIYGDKIYYRYNRKITSSGRALRNEDVERAFHRRKVTKAIVLLCMAIIMVLFINFVCSAVAKIIMDSTFNASNDVSLEVDEVIPDLIPAEKIKSPAEKSLQPKTTDESISKTKSEIIQAAHSESQIHDDYYYQTPEIVEEEQYVSDLVYRQPSQPSNDPVDVTTKDVTIGDYEMIEMPLPSAYYEGIDFSSYQAMEPCQKITSTSSPAYSITYSDNSYIDDNGLKRYRVQDGQFSVNGQDDYIAAMGTFYKTKGTAGERFLIETTTGSFTIIMGEEKADENTDQMNMFTTHKNNKKCIIEFIYDDNALNRSMRHAGTCWGIDPVLTGTITHIYKIV